MRLPPLAEEAMRRGARELQRNALQEGGVSRSLHGSHSQRRPEFLLYA